MVLRLGSRLSFDSDAFLHHFAESPDFAKNHLNESIWSQIRQNLLIDNKNDTHFYTLDLDGELKEATVLKYPFKPPMMIYGRIRGADGRIWRPKPMEGKIWLSFFVSFLGIPVLRSSMCYIVRSLHGFTTETSRAMSC
ncbi:hypothetical protein SLA2020_181890 [Shorea laevis]